MFCALTPGYFFAIRYRESPLFTVYTVYSVSAGKFFEDVLAEDPDAFCERILPSGSPSGAYSLRVTPDSVLIEAEDSAGIFYARQTLEFLRNPSDGTLPCVEIEDIPRFQWRGYMQDVSRHFFR